MNFGAILIAAVNGKRSVAKYLPAESLERIAASVIASEKLHSAEIRIAIESAMPLLHALRSVTPRERALEIFKQLEVWDTEQNNGILLYVLFAERRFEIVADRGADALLKDRWVEISAAAEMLFREHRYEEAILSTVQVLSGELGRTFPSAEENANELPDSVTLL